MLARTDSALVGHRRHHRRANTPAARAKRRQRANQNAGRYYCRGFWLSGRAAEGLIMRLILEGRLTETQATNSRLVDQALAQLLEEEGQRVAL